MENEVKNNMVHEVPNTPFSIVEGENKCVIVMGNQIVSEKNFESQEEALAYLETKPWEVIFAMMAVFCSHYEKILKYEPRKD